MSFYAHEFIDLYVNLMIGSIEIFHPSHDEKLYTSYLLATHLESNLGKLHSTKIHINGEY